MFNINNLKPYDGKWTTEIFWSKPTIIKKDKEISFIQCKATGFIKIKDNKVFIENPNDPSHEQWFKKCHPNGIDPSIDSIHWWYNETGNIIFSPEPEGTYYTNKWKKYSNDQ